MKLYTEESIIKAIGLYFNPKEQSIRRVIDQLTPIELPSDEEIDEASRVINKDGLSWENDFARDSFFDGAIWMKNEILNQKK